MPAIQPPFLPCYFSLGSNYVLPDELAENHYLSWEDALWDIIDVYKIQKGSIVLIPTFWCMDVVKNIGEHGLKCEYYPMNANFQTSEDELIQAIQMHHPAIVVIFHAVGIRNTLMTANNDWMSKLTDQQFVIEDSVHSIIDPREIIIKRDRHFVIDSWRKVMPLQGATMYSRKSEASKFSSTRKSFSLYSLRIIWLWVVMQIWLILSSIRLQTEAKSRSSLINRFEVFISARAEQAMLDAYDLIGDAATAGATLRPFIFLRKYINTSHIKNIKYQQVVQYENLLKPLWSNARYMRIQIQVDDYGELRGYPVALALSDAKQVIHALRENGVLVRSELEDSPWTQLRKVIYLPLGPYLSCDDIRQVCKQLLLI